jgi:hypothetical protein
MDFLKMAPIVDLLLFLFGIFWVDIAAFLQKRIAKCNSKLFSFFTAVLIYVLLIHIKK